MLIALYFKYFGLLKMLKTAVFAVFITIGISFVASAQDYKKNHVFLELGGTSFAGSVNYERYFFKEDISIRAGLGRMNGRFTTLLGMNCYPKAKNGKGRWHFGVNSVVGVSPRTGGVFQPWELNDLTLFPQPSIGRRWVSKEQVTFQITLMPQIGCCFILPYAGVSFGKQF